MAFEYIGSLLEEAVQTTTPVEVRGRVEQVVGTIIRAVVPGVKVGELCILRNPWENFQLKAEVVGFVRNVGPGDFKSVVICQSGNRTRVYYSPISSKTLWLRGALGDSQAFLRP